MYKTSEHVQNISELLCGSAEQPHAMLLQLFLWAYICIKLWIITRTVPKKLHRDQSIIEAI